MTTDPLKGKRVALIGGAGFIGHNLALALQERGAEPHIIDSLQVNNLGAFSNASNDPNKTLYMNLIYERLDAFQKDVSLMYAHWEQGTVNISEFDVDSQKFYGFIDDLQKRYRKFSKEYNKLVLDYNNFLARITHSYEQINMVSDKTQEILKKLPGHGNNINLN